MYSQKDDEQYILKYFGEKSKGRFLDIGANDGITFSNTRRLVELGWSGVCVEPDPTAFVSLIANNKENSNIALINSGLGVFDGMQKFYAMQDSLLSSFSPEQQKIWSNAPFVREYYVNQISWNTLLNLIGTDFDFVSIDAEGVSLSLLEAMPFEVVPAKMICVEHDSQISTIEKIFQHHNYREYRINDLNCIFVLKDSL